MECETAGHAAALGNATSNNGETGLARSQGFVGGEGFLNFKMILSEMVTIGGGDVSLRAQNVSKCTSS